MKLHEQRNLLTARAAMLLSDIARFQAYLHSNKFTGVDPRDGMPKDYINTHEVQRWMVNFIDTLLGGDDDTLALDIYDEQVLLGIRERDPVFENYREVLRQSLSDT